jgi:hypothetical protein
MRNAIVTPTDGLPRSKTAARSSGVILSELGRGFYQYTLGVSRRIRTLSQDSGRSCSAWVINIATLKFGLHRPQTTIVDTRPRIRSHLFHP